MCERMFYAFMLFFLACAFETKTSYLLNYLIRSVCNLNFDPAVVLGDPGFLTKSSAVAGNDEKIKACGPLVSK